jgi:YbgC/YbaW family acyl-CoA thioester hydrolase
MDETAIANPEWPVHEYRTLIRERHLDTFGHVNNAQYLVLFEEARWEMITSRGYGIEQVHARQIGTVVLECKVRFMRELKLREEITIRTRIREIRKKIIFLAHELVKESGDVAAEAEFTLGCFDLRERKLITPDPIWLDALSGKGFGSSFKTP